MSRFNSKLSVDDIVVMIESLEAEGVSDEDIEDKAIAALSIITNIGDKDILAELYQKFKEANS